jgi:hypothetical protein
VLAAEEQPYEGQPALDNKADLGFQQPDNLQLPNELTHKVV